MPTLIKKRGIVRLKGVVRIDGKVVAERLFPDNSPKSRKEAIKWEIETERELINREMISESSPEIVTVSDWFNKYLSYAESRFSGKTLSGKKLTFKRLARHKDISINTPVDEITSEIIDDVLKKCNKYVS